MAVTYSVKPWLSLLNSAKAVEFYKRAFEAVEVYRLEDPGGGLVVRLSVHGAEFWVSDGIEEPGSSVRIIVTVPNPEEVFARALAAGATEVFPVGEGHGWRLGRLSDPFGLHWEIGYELEN